MYDGYRSKSRDGGVSGASSGYRRRSPDHRGSPSSHEDRGREYYRRRNDRSRSPPLSGHNRPLSYDDDDHDDDPRRHFHPREGSDAPNAPTHPSSDHQQHDHSRYPADADRDRRYDNGRNNRGRYGSGGGDRGDDPGEHSDYHAPSRQYGGGAGRSSQPSLVVVLDGLPHDVRERDVYDGLDEAAGDRNMTRDQVRDLRIYDVKQGGCEALVHFFRLPDAESFVNRYFPEFPLRLAYSRGRDAPPVTVGVDFEKPRDQSKNYDSRYEEDDWECSRCGRLNYPEREVCYKCKAVRDYDGSSGPVLTGETDEDPQQNPSHYLVVRDLEASVSEEVLAKGITKLFLDATQQKEITNATPNKLKSTAPTTSTAGLGARAGTLRRVFLMRDRKTNESWRYGFAEFATVEDAKAAVAKFRALPKFTIASRPVHVGFIHTGVFVPSFEPPQGDGPSLSFAPVYNPNVQLQYWDTRTYPSSLVISTEPLAYGEASTEDQGAGDKPGGSGAKSTFTKKPKKEKDKDPANKAIAMAPQMQMWAKKAAELHGGARKTEMDVEGRDAPVLTETSGNMAPPQETRPDGPRNPHASDRYLSYADWENMKCLVCGWTPPSEAVLSNYNVSCLSAERMLIYHEVHAHNAYRDEEIQRKASDKLAKLGGKPRAIVQRQPRLRSELPPTYTSYADQDALHCHLCSRTFKKMAILRLHETESELHKSLLRSEKDVDRATAELRAKDQAPVTVRPSKSLQPQYRDRARERRQVFNQPKKPSNKPPGAAPTRKEKEPEPEEPKASKGAGMLAKMGWTSGSGLGAEGAGRVEAIATEAYAPGVGLGAEGGKLGDASEEAARNTKGNFSDFVEKTRDRARERFEKLG